jgi:hypothetical protein
VSCPNKEKTIKCILKRLIDLLNLGSLVSIGGRSSAASSTGESTGHATSTGHTAGTARKVLKDGEDNSLKGLLLLLKLLLLGGLVAVEPLGSLVDGGGHLALVLGGDLVSKLLVVDGVLHLEHVVLKGVLGLHAGSVGLVLGLVSLSLLNQALDLLGGHAALIVLDGDLLLLAGGLLHGGHVKDTVGIDIECDIDLGDTARHRGDALELELAKGVVVLGHGALALEDLDQHAGLVVGVGGEGLTLLGRHGGVALDEGGHDTAGSLNTKGQRGDIEQKEVLQLLGLVLARQNGGLDGGTEGNGLIRVDGLVELLAVEELGQKLLHLGDTGGTTDQDDLVDLGLGELGVLEHLLDGLHALTEVVHVEVLETGAGDHGVEIGSLEQGVDLNVGLGGTGQSSLCALAGSAEAAKSALVVSNVLSELALELLGEVVHEAVIEILTSQVGITSGGLHLEDALLNGKQGHIEGSTSKIEDQHVLLGALLVKAVGDGSSGGLVDNTKNVKAGNHTSVLGSLALGIVEVGRDSDDGVLHLATKVGLGNLLHLDEDHGRNLLRRELLLLTLECDVDDRLATGTVGHLERPVLHISLDHRVLELAADEALGIEHSVRSVHGNLVLGSVTDEALSIVECNIRGGGTVTLVVGNDLHAIVLPHSNAGVSSTQINSDRCSFDRHILIYYVMLKVNLL